MKKHKSREKRTINKYRHILMSIIVVALILAMSIIFLLSNDLFNRTFISPVPFLESLFSASELQNSSELKQLQSLLERNNFAFESINYFSDSAFLVKLKSGEEIIVSSNKSIKTQISSLQLIQTRLTIDGKSFSRLDLRFEKPVIVLK